MHITQLNNHLDKVIRQAMSGKIATVTADTVSKAAMAQIRGHSVRIAYSVARGEKPHISELDRQPISIKAVTVRNRSLPERNKNAVTLEIAPKHADSFPVRKKK